MQVPPAQETPLSSVACPRAGRGTDRIRQLALLSARIPEGDRLRGELDGIIGLRFRGSGPALVAGTVQPAGQPR